MIEPGPLVALAGVLLGLLAGQRAGPSDALSVPLAGVAGLLAAWFVVGRARVALASIALALLAAGSMQRALEGMAVSPLADAAREGAEVVVRGTLVTDPAGPRFGVDALVRVDKVAQAASDVSGSAGNDASLAQHAMEQAWRPAHRTVLARASGDEAGRLRVLAAGDGVTLRGYLSPLEGFDTRRRWRHAVAEMHDVEVRGFVPPTDPLHAVANQLRSAVLRGAATLPSTERSLLGGFLLGDTRDIPGVVVDDFRAAGLSHLLAVSGANVAFALAVARPALRRFSITGRLAGGLSVVVVFAAMTRFEPSVLRASMLAAVSMGAAYLGRPAGALRLLVIAIIALLLTDPFLLHSVGFILSCAASAGIAVFARPLGRRMRAPSWVREPLAVTLAAQIGVAPVLLPVFGAIPAVAPVSNVLAVPVADFLGVYGLLAGVAGGVVRPVAPALDAALQWPAGAAVRWIAGVARVSARVPLALDARAAVVLIAVIGTVWVLRRAGTPGPAVGAPGSLGVDAGVALPDGSPR